MTELTCENFNNTDGRELLAMLHTAKDIVAERWTQGALFRNMRGEALHSHDVLAERVDSEEPCQCCAYGALMLSTRWTAQERATYRHSGLVPVRVRVCGMFFVGQLDERQSVAGINDAVNQARVLERFDTAIAHVLKLTEEKEAADAAAAELAEAKRVAYRQAREARNITRNTEGEQSGTEAASTGDDGTGQAVGEART